MTRDYTAAINAALEHRNTQAALRKALSDALVTLERANPDHGEFWCAAHDVAQKYRAAKEAGAA